MIRQLAWVLLLATASQCSVATPSLSEQLRKAESGNASAQYELGTMYEQGKGAPKDIVEAVHWYAAAAEQDMDIAQVKLGMIFAEGKLVPQAFEQATIWFTRAATRGNADAQHQLGVLYCSGDGVAKDCEQGLDWFTKAAVQGKVEAQYALGVLYGTGMYRSGKSAPPDYKKAYIWFYLAARGGNTNAISNRDIALLKLTPEELEQAQDEMEKITKSIKNYKK
ncbi:MAG TPA: tetratricopeptide repeat protein [Pseudomonadales bacterium]|nr:tetratricopeptide repeat protein [Pseudomonadales bacterium]